MWTNLICFSTGPFFFGKLSAPTNNDYKPWRPQPLQIFIDFNFHTYNWWAYTLQHRGVGVSCLIVQYKALWMMEPSGFT